MMYIKHRKIFDYINKNLYIQVNENIPSSLCQGIVLAESIPLFVHTNVSQKGRGTLDWNYNFGTLFYESINSPFLLWKFYLEIICRVVFNLSQKFVLPLIFKCIEVDCRKYTYCGRNNCSNMKIVKVRDVFFNELVFLCKKIVKCSCLHVNPYFIIDAYKTHKKGRN